MGMMIDEHIKTLESYGKGRKGFTGQPIDFQASINFAIDTMRKYQKIEQIIEVWHQDIFAKDFECMAEIADVVEDGTNEKTSD